MTSYITHHIVNSILHFLKPPNLVKHAELDWRYDKLCMMSSIWPLVSPLFMASILFLLFLEIFIYLLLFYFYYGSYWFLVLSVLWEVSWANDWSYSELCFIVIQYAYIYLLHIVSAINEKVFSDTAWWYAFYCKLTSIFSFSSSSILLFLLLIPLFLSPHVHLYFSLC